MLNHGEESDRGENLAERFLLLAANIIRLCAQLPRSDEARVIKGQLLRCGTSTGANYEEARGAESRNDFIHKLGVVLKELKETRYWLRLILAAPLLPVPKVSGTLDETEQLIKIIGKSIGTSRRGGG